MPASKFLKQHWSRTPDAELDAALRAAHQSLDAFSVATEKSGSLIQSWVKGQTVVEFDHYPVDDVVDTRRGSQFFYHAHRADGVEHGHLHLFWHATSTGRRRYVAGLAPRWKRAAPTHLFAIGLDDRGLPVSLFTVNQWVTDGHWFDADTTLAMVDRFEVGDAPEHEASSQWLNHFVSLYRPLIADLLARRDKRLARRSDLKAALHDRRLELLSFARIDWAADLDALEAETARRRL